MGLRSFFRSLFRKGEKPMESGDRAIPDLVVNLDVDPSQIDPPETRYTEEYKEFVESLENDPSRTAEAAEETVRAAAEAVEETVEETAEAAAEAVEEAVPEAVEEAAEAVEEAVPEAADRAAEIVEDLDSEVTDVIDPDRIEDVDPD